MPMSIIEQLILLLREMQTNVPQIEGSELINVGGWSMGCSLPYLDGEDLPLLFVELFSKAQALMAQYPFGLFEFVCVQGENGVVLIIPMNEKCFLTVLTRGDVDGVLKHIKTFTPQIALLI